MKVKLPKELILKFITMEGLDLSCEYEINYDKQDIGTIIAEIDALKNPVVILNLADDVECFAACVEWYAIIQKYFRTSYTAYRLDIGPYKGLYPVSVDDTGRVQFEFYDIDLVKKDWKEWFMKEEFVYEPEVAV